MDLRLLLAAALALPALAAPAHAQARAGRYDVQGSDAALGAYAGQVELRSTGAGAYDYVRQVTYQQPQGGRALTTVWTGRATEQGQDLRVVVSLKRIGWITRAGALARTAADQAPVAVLGTLRPDAGGGLAGALTGAGVSATDVLRPAGAVGAAPLFRAERRLEPLHGRPPALLKTALFAVFAGYHGKPEVAPYTRDLRFRDAVHQQLIDRTGFEFLRARPQELLVVDQVVDAISLVEADVRRSAFGLRAHEKAALHGQDVDGPLRDVTGLVAYGARQTPSGVEPVDDMSTCLWSGVYLYSQALRHQVTREAAALQNVEQLAELLCDLVEIDPRPGEFARSLRPIGRAPLGGSWHAGQGRFAHLAWHDNGNNDMVKGLVLGFLGAWDVLPPNHPLRPRIVAAVRDLADHWMGSTAAAGVASGTKRASSGNKLMIGMLAHWITGDRAYQRLWQSTIRKPLAMLELASGGTFSAYGIADWSGTHLGVCSRIALVELGRRLRTPWQPLLDMSLESGWRAVRRYSRCTLPWSAARAGLLGRTGDGAGEATLWGLREFPYPKPQHEVNRRLDPEWVASPYPSLPWKMDWMTNPGRLQGLISYPTYMSQPSNYVWRSTPLDPGDPATDLARPAPDYLFVYWLARKGGVIAATE